MSGTSSSVVNGNVNHCPGFHGWRTRLDNLWTTNIKEDERSISSDVSSVVQPETCFDLEVICCITNILAEVPDFEEKFLKPLKAGKGQTPYGFFTGVIRNDTRLQQFRKTKKDRKHLRSIKSYLIIVKRYIERNLDFYNLTGEEKNSLLRVLYLIHFLRVKGKPKLATLSLTFLIKEIDELDSSLWDCLTSSETKLQDKDLEDFKDDHRSKVKKLIGANPETKTWRYHNGSQEDLYVAPAWQWFDKKRKRTKVNNRKQLGAYLELFERLGPLLNSRSQD